MSNAWIICLLAWDNSSKGLLIPDKLTLSHGGVRKVLAPEDESAYD